MKVQVLVDGIDRGTAELEGSEMLAHAEAISGFSQLVVDIYGANNPDGPDVLDVRADISLKPLRQSKRAKRAA